MQRAITKCSPVQACEKRLRFNAEGPDGLINRKAAGKAPTLTPEQRVARDPATGARDVCRPGRGDR